MQCPRCLGSGQCPDCKGQGTQECPACLGRGQRTTSQGQTYPCKACQGLGTIPCPPLCSSCEGSGEITAALQQKVRDTYTVRFANFTPSRRVTSALLALNLIVFILCELSPKLWMALLLNGDLLLTHAYWQPITSMFTHLGPLHLLLNMGFLIAYGPILEGLLGRGRFLALYLGGGIMAAGISFLGHSFVDGSSWAVGGASGALFAFDGAFIALYLKWRAVPWEPVRSLTLWAGLILVGGILAEFQNLIAIDNWSHGGGLIAGFILTIALGRPRGR